MNAVYAPAGMEFFGHIAADALGWPLYCNQYIGECDTVLVVGMYDPPLYDTTLANVQRAKRKVIMWCGTDVLHLNCENARLLPEATHLADAPWLVDELHEKGIDAKCVMWPTKHHVEVTPLPEKPKFSIYQGSPGRGEMYGSEVLRMLQDIFPDVEFHGYTLGQYDERGMAELIASSTGTLRLTHHDGSAASPREFMEAGRYAICSMPLDYAIRVRPDDLKGLVAAIKRVLAKTEPDTAASARWKWQNSVKRFTEEFEEAVNG